jgi:hypothetical protein
VELRDVMVGRDLGKNVEILSGVNSNTPVIINPSDSLVTGTLVRLADASAATNAVAQ